MYYREDKLDGQLQIEVGHMGDLLLGEKIFKDTHLKHEFYKHIFEIFTKTQNVLLPLRYRVLSNLSTGKIHIDGLFVYVRPIN